MKALLDYYGFMKVIDIMQPKFPDTYAMMVGPNLSVNTMVNGSLIGPVSCRKLVFILYDQKMIDGELVAHYKIDREQ